MSNPYAIDSIAYNPYFQMAYNSPNFYGVTQQAAAAQGVTTPQTAATAVTEQTIPAAKKEEKKDNTTAKLIVGTALALGAAYLCKKAYNVGQGTNAVDKILNGFGQWGKNVKNWCKGVKNKVVSPEKFSVTKIGNETVCTVPGKHNIVKGAEGAAEKLGQIGATTETPAILDSAGKLAEGIKIKNGTFVHDGKTFIVKKGKIVGCEGMTKEAFKEHYIKSTDGINEIKKIKETSLAKFLKGETGTVTQYSHTKDGVARLFEQGGDGAFNIQCGVSNKFNVNSDAVYAFRHDNPTVDTALKSFAENKTDGLKLTSAQFSRDDIGTLYIKDGEISAIKWTDGQTYQKGSEKWKSIMQQNKEAFENILKDTESLQNKVYNMA